LKANESILQRNEFICLTGKEIDASVDSVLSWLFSHRPPNGSANEAILDVAIVSGLPIKYNDVLKSNKSVCSVGDFGSGWSLFLALVLWCSEGTIAQG
jgi:hypothetical protein